MTPRVQLESRHAKLSEEFGYEYACRLFGKEAIDSLPLLQAGPHKGKPKGFLHWRRAMAAGYVRECAGPCKEGGLVDAWIGEFFGTLRDNPMTGMWCGRMQGLAGSRSVLTQEYRDFDAASKAQEAERQKEFARELREAMSCQSA